MDLPAWTARDLRRAALRALVAGAPFALLALLVLGPRAAAVAAAGGLAVGPGWLLGRAVGPGGDRLTPDVLRGAALQAVVLLVVLAAAFDALYLAARDAGGPGDVMAQALAAAREQALAAGRPREAWLGCLWLAAYAALACLPAPWTVGAALGVVATLALAHDVPYAFGPPEPGRGALGNAVANLPRSLSFAGFCCVCALPTAVMARGAFGLLDRLERRVFPRAPGEALGPDGAPDNPGDLA